MSKPQVPWYKTKDNAWSAEAGVVNHNPSKQHRGCLCMYTEAGLALVAEEKSVDRKPGCCCGQGSDVHLYETRCTFLRGQRDYEHRWQGVWRDPWAVIGDKGGRGRPLLIIIINNNYCICKAQTLDKVNSKRTANQSKKHTHTHTSQDTHAHTPWSLQWG